jgi:hypothetical protein
MYMYAYVYIPVCAAKHKVQVVVPEEQVRLQQILVERVRVGAHT